MAAVHAAIGNQSPYNYNTLQTITEFSRKFVFDGNAISASMQHTGFLQVAWIKHTPGYEIRLKKNNQLILTYFNWGGDTQHATSVTDTCGSLSAFVNKNDIITLESNLPNSTSWDDTYFIQSACLSYNSNYD